MKLLETNIQQTINEDFLVETLNLNGKTILELGCGAATMTKKIANTGFDRKVIACDIDEIQYKKNISSIHIENIEFIFCPAEKLPIKDNSIDIIFMFKSFHHIPKEHMKEALSEIKRVLKPNALAYISEPLFIGEQNELIAMFHNEEQVRIDAFDAIKNSIEEDEFKLFNEIFFQTEIVYENFADFEKKQMNLSYNHDHITNDLKNKIEEKFNSYNDGKRTAFLKPFRVDILQKIV